MGLMNTLKSALGLQAPVRPVEPEAFGLDASVVTRLGALPAGHGIHIATQRSTSGRTIQVDEGELQGPSPEGYERITVGDRNLERLRGLVLHHQGGGYTVSTHIDLRAKETPNPNGRLYECNRFLTDGGAMAFSDADTAPLLPAMVLRHGAVESVLLRSHTLTVERTPDTPWDTIDTLIASSLRTYFLGLGHRLTQEDASSGGLLGDIQRVLAQTILPAIHRDGGDLQLLGLDDGVLKVRLHGACRSCPASAATLQHGVKSTLMNAFPGQITAVQNVAE